MTWLGNNTPPAVIETDLDVFALYGQDNNNNCIEYLCIFNLNPDTIEKVSFILPERKVSSIDKLSMNGKWERVGFLFKR